MQADYYPNLAHILANYFTCDLTYLYLIILRKNYLLDNG